MTTQEKTKTKKHEQYLMLERLDDPTAAALFVGPYDSKEEAQAKIQEAIESGKDLILGDEPPEDPEKAMKVQIIAKINARREGLRSPQMGDNKNTLLSDIPNDFSVWDSSDINGTVKTEKRGRPRKAETVEAVEKVKTVAKKRKAEPKHVVEPEPEFEIEETEDFDMKEENRKMSVTESVVIVGLHKSDVIAWLADQGITGTIIPYVSKPEQIEGKIVVTGSVFPQHLAVHAKKTITIDVEGIPTGKRNVDLTYDELKRYGAKPRAYITREVEL